MIDMQDSERSLCTPVCSDTGDVEAVLEFIRYEGPEFVQSDLEVRLAWRIYQLYYLTFRLLTNTSSGEPSLSIQPT